MNNRYEKWALNTSPPTSGSALELAMRFHEAYERLAPRFGYETKAETREFDPQTPNGRLMIAVCREIIEHNRVIYGKEQPCTDFRPDEKSEWFGATQHQCPKCGGLRMFCMNCNRDHHKGGWESYVPNTPDQPERSDRVD